MSLSWVFSPKTLYAGRFARLDLIERLWAPTSNGFVGAGRCLGADKTVRSRTLM